MLLSAAKTIRSHGGSHSKYKDTFRIAKRSLVLLLDRKIRWAPKKSVPETIEKRRRQSSTDLKIAQGVLFHLHV
jgi:hypothetical protein